MSELDFIKKATRSLEEDAVKSITCFLKNNINSDGGFADRSGASDLYYTHFGVGSLLTLAGISSLDLSSKYISSLGDGSGLDFVHLCCLARSRAFLGLQNSITERILRCIEDFRSSDGGYNHRFKGAESGTVYAAFLARLAYDECGVSTSGWDKVISSLEKLLKNSGSYANEVSDTGGGITTVTAAAIVLLASAGCAVSERTLEWLMMRCDDAGGFRASENAPFPDLLSTAAALYALRSADESFASISDVCSEFVDMLWCDDGGFSGSAMDSKGDCEYTYYGLLSLGCLADTE